MNSKKHGSTHLKKVLLLGTAVYRRYLNGFKNNVL